MELIQALEKLSLEIRHNLNESQLEDFESSVSTLLGQISELDLDVKSQQFIRPTKRHKGSLCSTASSSQEDDSDGSSHQSNVPIFMDMLEKGEFANVTDSVRNISKILSIGTEIELIYEKLISGQQLAANQESAKETIITKPNIDRFESFDIQLSKVVNGRTKRTTMLDIMTLSDILALCDTYKNLCAINKQHTKYLPNLSKYNRYCDYLCNLSPRLSSSTMTPSPSSVKQSHGAAAIRLEQNPSETKMSIMDNTSDSGDETDLFEDDGFSQSLEYNEKQLNQDDDNVDNWTENKLYMNNQC